MNKRKPKREAARAALGAWLEKRAHIEAYFATINRHRQALLERRPTASPFPPAQDRDGRF